MVRFETEGEIMRERISAPALQRTGAGDSAFKA
jgi:hypothetical protein